MRFVKIIFYAISISFIVFALSRIKQDTIYPSETSRNEIAPIQETTPDPQEKNIETPEANKDEQEENIVTKLPATNDKAETVEKIQIANEKTKAISLSSSQIDEKESQNNENEASFIDSSLLNKKDIDIQSIVLVRCSFRSQYFNSSSQPWNEERFSIGSGVIISNEGHILTAEHVITEDAKADETGRIWKREGCRAAGTDKKQTPISAVHYWGQEDDPRFKEASIFFEPTKEEYKESYGLDFAILKIGPFKNSAFVPLEKKLVKFQEGDPVIVIAYPGKISVTPQGLERFDGKFKTLTYFEESSCDGTFTACGIRYRILRSLSEYQNMFWKETEFGIITPYARKGFSGGPAFFNGNLIGIVTHGKSGDDPLQAGIQTNEPDIQDVLISFDIFETLKKNGVSVPY